MASGKGTSAVVWGLQSLYRTSVLTLLSSFQGPGESKDSWATLGPLGLWVTEAPKGPKETKDSQVSGACTACEATAQTWHTPQSPESGEKS